MPIVKRLSNTHPPKIEHSQRTANTKRSVEVGRGVRGLPYILLPNQQPAPGSDFKVDLVRLSASHVQRELDQSPHGHGSCPLGKMTSRRVGPGGPCDVQMHPRGVFSELPQKVCRRY